MGGNLARAPIVGVFYAALLWYVAAFLPRSVAYAQSISEFTMPVTGLLMILVYAVVVAAGYAAVYACARRGGRVLPVLILCAFGLQITVPSLRLLLLGDPAGIMTGRDVILNLTGRLLATILTLLLCRLLYKPAPGVNAAAPGYKSGKLGLVIRLLVLPVIFCILYYLLWYNLFWRVDAAREFYGAAERQSFMGEIIDILLYRGNEVLITLLAGLLYAGFSLLLLTCLRGKRVLYIVANTILFVTGALVYLVPDPVMPAEVRFAHLFETGTLMVAYAVVSAVLLSSAFKSVETAAARPAASQVSAAGKQNTARRTQAQPGK